MNLLDLWPDAEAFAPPARPQLSLVREPGDGIDGVELRAQVPAGLGEPVRFRLRRSGGGGRDFDGMPVVAEGELPLSGPCVDPLRAVIRAREGTELVIRDAVPVRSWDIMSWVVEVQGEAGAWSIPSKRISYVVIPERAPAPPSEVLGVRSGRAVILTITHPTGALLLATPMGPFAFEIYRAAEGRPVWLEVPFDPAGGATFRAIDPEAPAGAIYAVRVVDPIGRPGAFAMSSSL
jgi:hypothetical protein